MKTLQNFFELMLIGHVVADDPLFPGVASCSRDHFALREYFSDRRAGLRVVRERFGRRCGA